MTSLKRIIASAVLITMLCSPLAYASDVSQPRTLWEEVTAYIQQMSPKYVNTAIGVGFSVGVGIFLFGQYVGSARLQARVGRTNLEVPGHAAQALSTFGGPVKEQLRAIYDLGVQRGRATLATEVGNTQTVAVKNGVTQSLKHFGHSLYSQLKALYEFGVQKGSQAQAAASAAEIANTLTPVIEDGVQVPLSNFVGETVPEQIAALYEHAGKEAAQKLLEELGNQVVLTGKDGARMLWRELDGADVPEQVVALLKLYTDFRRELLE